MMTLGCGLLVVAAFAPLVATFVIFQTPSTDSVDPFLAASARDADALTAIATANPTAAAREIPDIFVSPVPWPLKAKDRLQTNRRPANKMHIAVIIGLVAAAVAPNRL
jgi:hypothetical protein